MWLAAFVLAAHVARAAALDCDAVEPGSGDAGSGPVLGGKDGDGVRDLVADGAVAGVGVAAAGMLAWHWLVALRCCAATRAARLGSDLHRCLCEACVVAWPFALPLVDVLLAAGVLALDVLLRASAAAAPASAASADGVLGGCLRACAAAALTPLHVLLAAASVVALLAEAAGGAARPARATTAASTTWVMAAP